jgi:hypothetical protein
VLQISGEVRKLVAQVGIPRGYWLEDLGVGFKWELDWKVDPADFADLRSLMGLIIPSLQINALAVEAEEAVEIVLKVELEVVEINPDDSSPFGQVTLLSTIKDEAGRFIASNRWKVGVRSWRRASHHPIIGR